MYKDPQAFMNAVLGAQPQGGEVASIYEKRIGQAEYPSFAGIPHILYFYYVRIDNNGRLRVDHYRHVDGDINRPETWRPIDYSAEKLQEIVANLARNARPGAPRPRHPRRDRDVNFENIEWNRKCYVAIYIEEANWKFHKHPQDDSAIVFVNTTENGLVRVPNHSFFDAIDFEIEMPINRRRPRPGAPTTDFRSAIVFINHLKRDSAGNNLGAEAQNFEFKMFVKVNFAQGTTAPMTVIFDPGGTNQGPPTPPPE